MNVNLINDIINDYTKLYDELYKKRYSEINELLDKSKKDLDTIKEEISSIKEINLLNKDSLSEKNTNFILIIKEVLKNKLNKYIIDFLNVLKKFIQYKLWTKINSHETINLMKEISKNPKNSIECQNKIVEVLQTLLFASFFELNENDIINIYLINLRVFNCTNNYQNYDFKNPIRLLFITLTDITFKSNNNELIMKITKFIFSLYIKDDTNNNDNEYLELLKDFQNNIYIKCLSLELLSQGLKIIKTSDKKANYLDEIINTKIELVIKNNLDEIKKYSKNNDQYYIHFLKICRISIIIIKYYNIDYDILKSLLSFLNDEENFTWVKNISMECLQEILTESSVLINIYNFNKEIISNIFSTLSLIYGNINDITYKIINKRKIVKNKKQIEKNNIYLQGDENSVIKESESNNIIFNIKECLKNTINSFSSMMNEHKLTINNINNNLSKEQEIIKEIIVLTSSNIKKILYDLMQREYNEKECDSGEVQKTLNLIQNLIILYSSLNIIEIRDEYLKLICTLCLNFENEKNIIICQSLLSLSKYTQFFNQETFIIIFNTIEKIHIKYYNKNEKKKNVDLIIKDIFQSYQKFFTPNEKENNENQNNYDIEYKNEKIEKENLLCSTINTMFIDSKSLNIDSLKNIIGALYECLKIALNNKEENENKKEEIIIFHLTKILTLTLLNIENIFILFDDYLIPIINLLIEKKILLNFTVNLVCSVIKEILINYQKIEANIKERDKKSNKENNWWLNEKWQKKLFAPLNSFTKDHNLIELTKNRLFICISTIIQQSGNYIDIFGWGRILKICQILINYNIEEIFLIVKLILNEYNTYLTIFNVTPIITLLGAFISYQKDKNICFNSIELFWSCSNIVENYHKGKITVNEPEQKIFEELLKEQKVENFDIFYNGLYYKIFSQLLRINSDFRNDIRKSAIKVFTEIFVSKMNTIEYDNCFKIINDIFFNTFLTNLQKYIDNEKKRNIKEEDINDNKMAKENELEQTFQASLLSIIKILKSYFNSEQKFENENKKENMENTFALFLKKLSEIMPYGTVVLNSDILHGLSELKNIQNNKKNIIASNLDLYFELMNKTKEFINSPRFKLSLYNKMKCIKFLNCIIITLNDLFCNELNYNIFSISLNEIFQKINEILEFIFNANLIIEKKSLESSPLRLTEVENSIFTFIENNPLINEKYIYDFIINYIVYDLNNFHTGVICKRAIECLANIINKSKDKDNCYILKENEGQKKLYEIFDKFKILFNLMNNENIIKYFINYNKNEEAMFTGFICLICKLFFSIINKVGKNNEDIILEIISFSEAIFDKCIKGIKIIKEKDILLKIIDIYCEVIKNIIQFLFIDLFPLLIFILNEKENEPQKTENKFLKMLLFKFDNENKILNKIINETINKVFINSLFKISKYQTEEEIINYINKNKIKENFNSKKYVSNFITFKKKCTSLLISKLTEILVEYKKEYENKNEENLTLKIVELLNEIKNLEVFPDLMNINNNKENKKIHIAYLYNIITDFILVDNKDIQILVKDILMALFNEINLPPLPTITFEDK